MILTIIVILAVIAADIATKYAAALNLAEGEAVTVIPGVVEFSYVENRGAAFGMLADHRWVFLVFSSIAIVGILAYLFVKRPKERLFRIALAMIAGGGVGNMIERLAHGYVTDFINPTFVKFYVFNVADSCVTIGCGLLILWMIVDTVKESKKKKLAGGAGDTVPEDDAVVAPIAPEDDAASNEGENAPNDSAPASGGETEPEGERDE